MRAKYAKQIRKGIRRAKNFRAFSFRTRRTLYQAFMRNATFLEWRAFDQYRQRHWTD